MPSFLIQIPKQINLKYYLYIMLKSPLIILKCISIYNFNTLIVTKYI